jgi:mannose-6-phosphate isomerase-like protein (cupin superfamily)
MEAFDLFQSCFDNTDFRRVLYSGDYSELAVMNISAGEDHETGLLSTDKLVIVLRGHGEVVIGDISARIKQGGFIAIPAEVDYAINNNSDEDLKLIIVYAPAQFSATTIHGSRVSAVMDSSQSIED